MILLKMPGKCKMQRLPLKIKNEGVRKSKIE